MSPWFDDGRAADWSPAGWETYHNRRYPPEHLATVTAFQRWKMQTTGATIMQNMRASRNDVRARYLRAFGSDPRRWPFRHPVIGLSFNGPTSFEGVCLRCDWLQASRGSSWVEQSATARGCVAHAQRFVPISGPTFDRPVEERVPDLSLHQSRRRSRCPIPRALPRIGDSHQRTPTGVTSHHTTLTRSAPLGRNAD
jgi:hypothetical protein